MTPTTDSNGPSKGRDRMDADTMYAQTAKKTETPDAAVARNFYDVMYRNALALQKEPAAKLYYQPRWRWKDGSGKWHMGAIESIEWRAGAWKQYERSLDTFLMDHAQHILMPVPALLKSPASAGIEDLGCVAFLIFDADEAPLNVYGKAFQALGRVSLIVWSGSVWKDPATGKEEGKLHGYYRLKKPAVAPEEIAKAVEAQSLLTKITGGDRSMTCVHPLGLPGSINPKVGKLREIAPGNEEYASPDAEIDLDEALAVLRAAAGVTRDGKAQETAKGAVSDFSGNGATTGLDVSATVSDLVEGKNRHGNATKLAAHYAGSGMKRSATRDLLKGIISGAPWEETRKDEFFSGELDRIIDSAFDKFAKDKFLGDKPLPLTDGSSFSTDFPVTELPPLMRDAALAASAETSTPVAYAAMAALGSASASVAYIADVEAFGSGSAPLGLYLLNIAESGARKTAVDTLFRDPFDDITNDRTRAFRRMLDIYNADRQNYDAAVKQRSKNGGPLPPKPIHPAAPHFVHSDTTPEGLTRNMTDGASLGVLWSSEGRAVFGGAGFTRERAEAMASALNRMWDGKKLERTRAGGAGGVSAERGGAVSIVQNPRLVINVAIQVEPARDVLSSPINRALGLSARLLIAYPDPNFGHRKLTTPDTARTAAIKAYNAVIADRLRLSLKSADTAYMHDNAPAISVQGGALSSDPFTGDTAAKPSPETSASKPEPAAMGPGKFKLPVLSLSPAARTARDAFYDEVEPRQASGGDLEFLRDFASKAVENAIRIAGVLTVFENETATEITEARMRNGIALMNWFLSCKLRFEGGTDGTAYAYAEKLLNWIRSNVTDEVVGSRTILQRGPNPVREKKVLNDVAQVLVERGWLLPLTESEGRLGVPTSEGLVRSGWRLHAALRDTEA
jgi:hypothetical protein